jgi:hypothetical protein
MVLKGTQCMLDFSLLSLELDMTQRPFDNTVKLRLGGICMKQTVGDQQPRIISTPMADGRADYLFTTKLVMVSYAAAVYIVLGLVLLMKFSLIYIIFNIGLIIYLF